MPAPAVEIRDLVMRYGSTVAVAGIDLDIVSGSVTSVLGPNGAGKTTLIETCEGFRPVQSGRVRVLGEEPGSAAVRPRVGVMLQTGGAWSGVRAHEMLRHMAALHAHPLDVDELIERLGLASCGNTPFRRLSGGQQQRLSLAMSVVGRPELVFLDEPTAGLDPQARRATWDLIDELRAHGVTTVLTTHFMDEAEALSDVVHIIDSGRIIASGTPADLTRTAAQNTLRLQAAPGIAIDLLQTCLPSGSVVDEPLPGTYVVTGEITPALLAAVAAWCADQGVLVESIMVERQTLEDRFLDLTERALR